jgi:Ca2+-binding EF-hand superfamily protein
MKAFPSQFDDIEELFNQADADGDDQIGLTEFRGLMQELDRQMRDEVVSVRFIEIDTNRDGRIGFGEFRTWWLGA